MWKELYIFSKRLFDKLIFVWYDKFRIAGGNMDIKIYEIKGKLVMLDSDLAKIYECKNGTK